MWGVAAGSALQPAEQPTALLSCLNGCLRVFVRCKRETATTVSRPLHPRPSTLDPSSRDPYQLLYPVTALNGAPLSWGQGNPWPELLGPRLPASTSTTHTSNMYMCSTYTTHSSDAACRPLKPQLVAV